MNEEIKYRVWLKEGGDREKLEVCWEKPGPDQVRFIEYVTMVTDQSYLSLWNRLELPLFLHYTIYCILYICLNWLVFIVFVYFIKNSVVFLCHILYMQSTYFHVHIGKMPSVLCILLLREIIVLLGVGMSQRLKQQRHYKMIFTLENSYSFI